MADAVEKLPFKLARPNPSTSVTDASEIDYGTGENKQSLDSLVGGLKSNEVVIDLSTNILTYKNQTFMIIGIDDSSSPSLFVLGSSIIGTDILSA